MSDVFQTPKKKKKKRGKGRPFAKGNKANPLGQKAHDPLRRAAKKFLKEDFHDAIGLVTDCSVRELQALIDHPDTPIGKVIMAKSLLKARDNSDHNPLLTLAEVVIGKPKETHEHSVKNPYEGMTPEQLAARQKELDDLNKAPQLEAMKDVTPKEPNREN